MLEVLIGLALAGLGFYGGCRAAKKAKPQPALTNQEEDEAAFELLMGYNQRQAYGQEEYDGV